MKVMFDLDCKTVLYFSAVVPGYEKVPRDWENVFVIVSGEGVHYKGNPFVTNLWENNQNICHVIGVRLGKKEWNRPEN